MNTSPRKSREKERKPGEGAAPAEPCATTQGSAGASSSLLARLALASRTRGVWLRVGQLIDGVSDAAMRNANVVFDADSIRFVGANDELPARTYPGPGRPAPDAALPTPP